MPLLPPGVCALTRLHVYLIRLTMIIRFRVKGSQGLRTQLSFVGASPRYNPPSQAGQG